VYATFRSLARVLATDAPALLHSGAFFAAVIAKESEWLA
jgi:hypothetical protein